MTTALFATPDFGAEISGQMFLCCFVVVTGALAVLVGTLLLRNFVLSQEVKKVKREIDRLKSPGDG